MDNWHAEAARFTPGLRVKLWPAGELDSFLDRLGEADLHVLNYSQLRMLGESLAPVSLAGGDSRRRPVHQEPQLADRPGGARPARRAPAGALGHAHREPAAGSLEPDGVCHARRARQPRTISPGSTTPKTIPSPAGAWPRGCGRSCCAAPKSQVAKDLPDRIEEDLYCEIEGEQQTLYRAELKRAQQMLLKVKTQKQLAE